MLFKSQRNPGRSPAAKEKAVNGTPLDISRWLGAAGVDRLRSTLSEAGVELTGSHTGRLPGEHFAAEVQLEPDELIRVHCAVDLNVEPRRLLERYAGGPGSVRCALSADGLRLAAETRVDGVVHLPRSLANIREGFSLAFEPDAPRTQGESSDVDSAAMVRAALDQAGWPKEDSVETNSGYELQPRIEGNRVSVSVVPLSGAALVARTVLPALPEGIAGEAVAHQALVWNDHLRCCRLAAGSGGLAIESRLHAQQIDEEWLSFTVRAVAAAACRVEPELQLLARDAGVAQAYAEMFEIAPAPEPHN